MLPTESANSTSAVQARQAAIERSRRAAAAAAEEARRQADAAKLQADSTRRAAQVKRADAQSMRERLRKTTGKDAERLTGELACTPEGRATNQLIAQLETLERQGSDLEHDAAVDARRAALAVRDLANFAASEAATARAGAESARQAALSARAAAEHALIAMNAGCLDRDTAFREWTNKDSTAQRIQMVARAFEADAAALEGFAASAAKAADSTESLVAMPEQLDRVAPRALPPPLPRSTLVPPADPDDRVVIAAAFGGNPVSAARLLQRAMARVQPALRHELIRELKPQLAEAARKIQMGSIAGVELEKLVDALSAVADLAGLVGARELGAALVSRLDPQTPARLGHQLILSTHRGDTGALAAAIANATGAGPLHDWAQSAVAGALGLTAVDRLTRLGLSPSKVQQASPEERRLLLDASTAAKLHDIPSAIQLLARLGTQARDAIVRLAAELPESPARRLLENEDALGALLGSKAGIAAVEALAEGDVEIALEALNRARPSQQDFDAAFG